MALILRSNANRTEVTARMSGYETGGGGYLSCNVNRMRKAYLISFHMMLQFVPICQNATLTNFIASL